jgi:hypothetical protein
MALGPSFRWGREGGTHLNQSPTPCAGRRLALMPYTHRTPEQRAELERQAKALRAQGASMAEIERATGVPVPTLYQWAARGGWRACDLVRERLDQIGAGPSPSPLGEGKGWGSGVSDGAAVDASHPTLTLRGGKDGTSGRGAPTPQASQGEQPPAASARTRPTGGEGGQDIDVSADALRSAGERALAAALQLAQAGQAKAARDQLLLGQRFVAAAEHVSGFETQESQAARRQRQDYEVSKAELENRLLRLLDHQLREMMRATGLDQIEGLDPDSFDFEPFRIGEDDYRRATPEEIARIRAEVVKG